MENKSIGEMARGAALNASTLRYYESIGLLLPTERENGQRRYDNDALKRLSMIRIFKETGFTLKEIGLLLSGFSEDTAPSARWKLLASEKLREIDAQISRAKGMKKVLEEGLHCDCLSLDECVTYFNGRDGKIA